MLREQEFHKRSQKSKQNKKQRNKNQRSKVWKKLKNFTFIAERTLNF